MPKPKAKRGRPAGFVMSNAHRLKIQRSNIITALIQHAAGNRDMSATQVTAGLGLLKKYLPDLAALTISGDQNNPIQTITRIELVAEDGDRPD